MDLLRKTIGKNLEAARKEKGLTQTEVGEKFKSGRAYISLLENGGGTMSFAKLYEFSKFYEKEFTWFFKDHDNDDPENKSELVPLDLFNDLIGNNKPKNPVVFSGDDLERLARALVKMLGAQKAQKLVINIMEALASGTKE